MLRAPRLAPCPLWASCFPSTLLAQVKAVAFREEDEEAEDRKQRGCVGQKRVLVTVEQSGPAPYRNAVLSHPPRARHLPQET